MRNDPSRTPNTAAASLLAIVAFGFWLSVSPALTPAQGAMAAPASPVAVVTAYLLR